METTWQRVTSSLHDCNTTSLHHNYSANYHALLLKLLLLDMDHNCTTTGFEVRTCTVTSPSHKKEKFISLIEMCDTNVYEKNFPSSVTSTKYF